MKKRVTGLGGVFFKARDPEKIRNWYNKHLGIETDQYGGKFIWRAAEGNDNPRLTAWNPFPENTTYYEPSKREFMFNYRVEDLETLLEVLRQEGVRIVGEMQVFEYGKFAWIMDPEGTKIELWEPLDKPLVTPPMNKSS